MKKMYLLPEDFAALEKAISEQAGQLRTTGAQFEIEKSHVFDGDTAASGAADVYQLQAIEFRKLQEIHSNHVLIKKPTSASRAIAGVKVKLSNSGTFTWYEICGHWIPKQETTPDGQTVKTAQRITLNTPIARAVIGKEVGDEITPQTPNSEHRKTYTLVGISL